MAVISSIPGHVDLVLQGGGIKAVALVGALSGLVQYRFLPRRMAGASAGAIVAGLIAAGYGPAELRAIITDEPFPDLLDSRWYTRLPGIGRPLALLWRMGMHPGDRLLRRLTDLLEHRGVRTFGDLRANRDIEPLRVVVSDVTGRRLLVFPGAATEFGLDPDRLSVPLVLRMSAGIPIVYEPVRLKDRRSRRDHLLVDGGMLSNFPLWIFDDRQDHELPVIGLRLVDTGGGDSLAERLPVPGLARTRFGALVDYVESLARTMMEAHDRRYLDAGEIVRTIEIPTNGVAATEFDLDPGRIEELWRAGERAVRASIEPLNDQAETVVG